MESYISYIVVVIVHFSSFYPLSALRFCVATTFSMMHDYAPEQYTVTGEKLTVNCLHVYQRYCTCMPTVKDRHMYTVHTVHTV